MYALFDLNEFFRYCGAVPFRALKTRVRASCSIMRCTGSEFQLVEGSERVAMLIYRGSST